MPKKALSVVLCLVLLASVFPALADSDPPETISTFGDISSLFFLHGFILGEDSLEFYATTLFANETGEDLLREGIWDIISRWCSEGSKLSVRPYQYGAKAVKISNITMRPGIRMAEAYANGLTDRLSKTEKNCLKEIGRAVQDLQKKHPAGSVELELAIYDYICDRLEYRTSKSSAEREKLTSACYAFLNREGNCQAYADLFYTMTTIAGFETSVIAGEVDGGHVWNTILIGSDLVMVDVTFGDSGDSDVPIPNHYWFNFGLDRVGNHKWNKQVFDYEFLKKTRTNLTYYSNWNDFFGTTADSPSKAVEYCMGRGKRGKARCEVLLPGRHWSSQDFDGLLKKKTRGRRYCEWTYWLDDEGPDTVLRLYWNSFDGKKLK